MRSALRVARRMKSIQGCSRPLCLGGSRWFVRLRVRRGCCQRRLRTSWCWFGVGLVGVRRFCAGLRVGVAVGGVSGSCLRVPSAVVRFVVVVMSWCVDGHPNRPPLRCVELSFSWFLWVVKVPVACSTVVVTVVSKSLGQCYSRSCWWCVDVAQTHLMRCWSSVCVGSWILMVLSI